jgi:hypothetical protein
VLEGDLTDFPLPDILRLLAATAKTGRLRLHHADGDAAEGRVDLVDGQVVDASADAHRLPLARRLLGLGLVDGDRLLRGIDAAGDGLPTDRQLAATLVRDEVLPAATVGDVHHDQVVDAAFDLLRWGHGTFRFDAHVAPGDAAGAGACVSVSDLLDAARTRLDRWDEVLETTGPGSAVVAIARPEADAAVDADGWGLLGLIDGRRRVDELIRLAGQGEYRTRGTLRRLVELGVVRVDTDPAGPPVDRLVDLHRRLASRETAAHATPLLDAAPAARPAAAEPAPPAVAPAAPAADPAPDPAELAAVVAVPAATDSAEGRPQAVPAATGPVARAVPAGPTTSASPRRLDPAAVPAGPTTSASPRRPDPADPAGPTSSASPRQLDPVPASAGGSPSAGPEPASVTPLRGRLRPGRLTTDPDVDAALVARLIDGVEGLS